MPRPLQMRVSVDIGERDTFSNVYHASTVHEVTGQTEVSALIMDASADLSTLISNAFRMAPVSALVLAHRQEEEAARETSP